MDFDKAELLSQYFCNECESKLEAGETYYHTPTELGQLVLCEDCAQTMLDSWAKVVPIE